MPSSKSWSRVLASRWESVDFTPKVSTKTVRSTTDGSSRCIWSWALAMVATSASPNRTTPRIDWAGPDLEAAALVGEVDRSAEFALGERAGPYPVGAWRKVRQHQAPGAVASP